MVDGARIAGYIALSVRMDEGTRLPGLDNKLAELVEVVADKVGRTVVDRLISHPAHGIDLELVDGAVERAASEDSDFATHLNRLCSELEAIGGAELANQLRRVIRAAGDTEVCATCGARNSRESVFCDTCGSYLEWLPGADQSSPTGDSASTPSSAQPVEATSPLGQKPLGDTAHDTRDCWTCGEANEASRRFCSRCGATLTMVHGATAPAPSDRLRWSSRGRDSGHRRETTARPHRRSTESQPQLVLPPSTQAAVDAALDEVVTDGRLLISAAEDMRQGTVERVEVAIARHKELDSELRQVVTVATAAPIEDVETSPFMTVELKGSAFDITPLDPKGGGEQLLRPTALWQFDVIPQRSGSQQLKVCVAMRIPIQGRPDERVSVPVVERSVRVRVNAGYNTRRFIRAHWQWCLVTIAGLGGAIGAWLKLFQGGGT